MQNHRTCAMLPKLLHRSNIFVEHFYYIVCMRAVRYAMRCVVECYEECISVAIRLKYQFLFYRAFIGGINVIKKIEQIFHLKFNFMAAQKRQVFLSKRMFSVMLRLVQNVLYHVVQIAPGMRKRAISLLPNKFERRKVLIFDKIGGFRFQHLYCIG